jgi:hypothetical protein
VAEKIRAKRRKGEKEKREKLGENIFLVPWLLS